MTQRAKNEIDPVNPVVASGQTLPGGAGRPRLRLDLGWNEAHPDAAKCHVAGLVDLDNCYFRSLTIDLLMESGNRMNRTKQRQYDRQAFESFTIAHASARSREEVSQGYGNGR